MSERKGAQGDGFVKYLKPRKPGESIYNRNRRPFAIC